MDFTIDGTELGTHASEVNLSSAGTVHASVRVSALLEYCRMRRSRLCPMTRNPIGRSNGRELETHEKCRWRSVPTARWLPKIKSSPMEQSARFRSDVPIAREQLGRPAHIAGGAYQPTFVMVGKKPICASLRERQWGTWMQFIRRGQKRRLASQRASKRLHGRHTITLKESTRQALTRAHAVGDLSFFAHPAGGRTLSTKAP